MSGCTDTVNYCHTNICDCSCHIPPEQLHVYCKCRMKRTEIVNSPPLQNDHKKRIKELEERIDNLQRLFHNHSHCALDAMDLRIEALEQQCADKPKESKPYPCPRCNGKSYIIYRESGNIVTDSACQACDSKGVVWSHEDD